MSPEAAPGVPSAGPTGAPSDGAERAPIDVTGDASDAVHRILLSGPIGSGKSTVGVLMRELGATVIEADRVGHAVLEPDGGAFDQVADRWPHVVIDGRIDRPRLAAVVFSDGAQLAELESFTHPAIARRIESLVESAEMDSAGPVVVEMPLLGNMLGTGWHRLVVTADAPVRRSRAVGRGMDPADVDRRMANQPPMGEWLVSADSTIANNGDLDALHAAVLRWWERHVAPA